jgi:hypothetical protein
LRQYRGIGFASADGVDLCAVERAPIDEYFSHVPIEKEAIISLRTDEDWSRAGTPRPEIVNRLDLTPIHIEAELAHGLVEDRCGV